MCKQIFRKNVPPALLYELLSKICLKTEKYYCIDMNAFRKMTFHLYHEPFFRELLEYYHTSKQFYVTRPLTYNSFTTVIRQICKSNEIMFTSNLHYIHSKYNIDYFVFFEESPESNQKEETKESQESQKNQSINIII